MLNGHGDRRPGHWCGERLADALDDRRGVHHLDRLSLRLPSGAAGVSRDRYHARHDDDRREEHILHGDEEVGALEEYADGEEDQPFDLVDEHEEEKRRRRDGALSSEVSQKCQSHRDET